MIATTRRRTGVQRGQALPLGLALILFGALGALVLYNTGQTATDKTRLVNAADAAAYSGALWQARAMNFQAYTNRAMVANEVSIAQAVSLRSWASYGENATANVGTAIGWVPVIGQIATAIEQGMKAVAEVLGPISEAMVGIIDVVNRGVSLAQEAMFASTFIATPDIVESVASGTDDRFRVDTAYTLAGTASNLQGWQAFTTRFEPGTDEADAVAQQVQLINDSRDRFSEERNWRFFSFWVPSSPLHWHKLIREGETHLVQVGDTFEWKAKDTVSFHTRRLRFGRRSKKTELPIGWAEAYANEGGETSGVREGWLNKNDKAERWAAGGTPNLRGVNSSVGMGGYTGVQAFRTLSDAVAEDERPALKLKVEVAMGSGGVEDSGKLLDAPLGDPFDMPVTAPGELLSSIGIAEVFYHAMPDAPGSDRRLEQANGYNPYWDVRLSAQSPRERLLALALRPGGSGALAPALASYGELPGDGAEGTGGEAGRADGPLPDYADTLVEAEGVAAGLNDDIASAESLVREFGGGELTAIGQSFASEFPDVASIEHMITGTLETAFDDVVGRILQGFLDSALDSPLGQAAQDALATGAENVEAIQEDFEQFVDESPAGRIIGEAEAFGTRVADHFKEIAVPIADEFEEALETALKDAADDVRDFDRDIREAWEVGQAIGGDPAAAATVIAGLTLERDAVANTMRDELAESFRGIVNRHADPAIYRMSSEHALSIVTEILREIDDLDADPGELVENFLPWNDDD